MRIAQLAPPLERVPPERYGGTERVISCLTEELVRRGHEVTLYASGDSLTAAELVPVVERALWHQEPALRDFTPFWTVLLGKLWRHLERFDIVHSHLDYLAFPLARAASRPVLTTLHGRLDLPPMRAVYEEFDEVPLVSISDAQRAPVAHANWVGTVQHGIELGEFSFNPGPGAYLAFLGRMARDKGVHTAIRVARQAGMPIKIAARLPLPYKNDPLVADDWDYYEREVLPLLEGTDVELIGQIGGRDKDRFLGNASALLFPIQWPEPFGLVMPEALACGTPVIALHNGSVPEILTHEVTGFICENADEMVAAVGRIGEINRATCREEAERRFSPTRMAEEYELIYQQLVVKNH